MKLHLLFAMFLVSLTFISATSVKVQPNSVADYNSIISETPSAVTSVKKSKLNFVERLFVKYVLKKIDKADDTAKANKQASTSLSFGIATLSLFVLSFFIPPVLLGTLPTAIVALVTGSSALKNGTTETSKARLGKAFGLATLIALGALLVIGLIFVAAFLSGWGG